MDIGPCRTLMPVTDHPPPMGLGVLQGARIRGPQGTLRGRPALVGVAAAAPCPIAAISIPWVDAPSPCRPPTRASTWATGWPPKSRAGDLNGQGKRIMEPLGAER